MLKEKGVLKYRVGIETMGGVFTPLFEKETPLPANKTQIFTSAADKQRGIDLHLLEGDELFASKCRSLGRFIIKGFTIAPQGIPQIAITISIEKDGTLSINAVEKPQGNQVAVDAKANSEPVIVSVQNP